MQGDIPCGTVVVAAGAWSGRLLEHLGVHAPTPPVKGQIVLLARDRRLLRRIVEHGKNYLVPRDDGRILIGATEEDAGFDTPADRPRRHATFSTRPCGLCPVLGEAVVEATWAGLRPGSIDTKPYIGSRAGLREPVRRHRPQASRFAACTGHRRDRGRSRARSAAAD